MTKRELIDQITVLNPSAQPAFLADFDGRDLAEYLQHLKWVIPEGGPRYADESAGPVPEPAGAPLFAAPGAAALGA